MHYFSTISAASLAILLITSAARCEDRDAKESAARIRHLIGLLASKNPAPRIEGDASGGDDPEIRFDSQYDKTAQVPVYLALNQLLSEGEGAFELLLQHSDDKRYAFSVNSYHDYNVTVGGACEKIVYRNIVCFEPEMHVITRSQFGLYPPREQMQGQSLREWWEKNKRRGLNTIQVEAMDTMIAFMQEVDGRTAPPWHPAAEPLPLEEFNRFRDKNLQTLKSMRHTILSTGKPLTAKTIEGHVTYFFGLPWTSRKYNK